MKKSEHRDRRVGDGQGPHGQRVLMVVVEAAGEHRVEPRVEEVESADG